MSKSGRTLFPIRQTIRSVIRPDSELWGLPLFLSLFAVTFTLLVFLISIYESFEVNILPAAGVFIFLSAIFWLIDPLLKERLPPVVSSVFLTAIYLSFAQLLIFFSGKLESPFFLVYYFVVFTGAMSFGLTGALAVTFVVALAYASFCEGIEDLPPYMLKVLVLWIISLMVGFLAETKKRIERREAIQNLRLTALEEIAHFMRELSSPDDVIEATADASLKLLDADEVKFVNESGGALAVKKTQDRKESTRTRSEEFPIELNGKKHSLVIRRRAGITLEERRIVRLLLEKTRLISEHLHFRAVIEADRKEKERVLDSIGSGVLTLDLEGKVKTANRRASQILKYDEGKIVGIYFASILRQPDNVDEESDETRECALRTRDGEEIPAEIRFFPQLDERGTRTGRIVVFEDLKQIRRLEAVLRRSEALAAVGEMSARIAHEIRNPLGGIMGFLGLAEKDSPEGVRGYIREASQAVTRLEKTIKDLLLFAHPVREAVAEVKLADAWDVILARGRAESAGSPATKIRIEPLAPRVAEAILRGGAVEFEHVIGNLLRNAVDAASPSGVVEICARWGGDQVWIEVTDTGEGCPPELVARMYEPFVSGKATGSGLGLSIARKILDEIGGTIRYERVPVPHGAITKFRVSWPLAVDKNLARSAG